MINLPARKLREGMITSQSIYNAKGVSYLSKGTRLNQPYIRRLKKLGIARLSVTSLNPSLHLLPPEDIVQEKTRITAIHKVCEAFAQLEVSNTFNLDSLENIAESIIFDLISKQSNLAQITDIRLHDTYTFAHSVNVAVLSSMLGSLCHYSKKKSS
jgi:HD-GYP domain-containing protein (c-di-GMP phosphodiesterase class II)